MVRCFACFLIVFVGSIFVLSSNTYCLENLLIVNDVDYDVLDSSEGVEIVSVTSDLEDVLDIFDLVVVRQFEIDNKMVVEGYSNKIKNYIVVDGLRINVQVCKSDDNMIVGSPLIKSSFWYV